jgi:putative SOS response-associated peptidase YedK
MCGRYLFKLQEDAELELWRDQLGLSAVAVAWHEVRPSQQSLVFDGDHRPHIMRWGLPKWDQKGLIINARSESVAQSLFFKAHLTQRRVIVRADGFFEWDRDQQKHLVSLADSEPLYLAALYDETHHFAILTTEAQGAFRQIHHRVPLILNAEQRQSYLDEGLMALSSLEGSQARLSWHNQSPQIRLF